jgi:deazaflavin-dependent oxidoreductase (nitroreductase family)
MVAQYTRYDAATSPQRTDLQMATYKKPDWFTKHIFNPIVAALATIGITPAGARVLTVRGRRSGKPYSTPVNPLDFNGARYLVAPRGNTQWVRNIRASGEAELRAGRKRERIRVREVGDDEKAPLLRAYLKRWKWEVGQFFGGVDDKAPDEDLRRIAPNHPVFRIES